ncbi:MAG TPA: hydroxyacid dehydrogenase, partial [Mycoplana sp.]|nr:hydroxyacid dehydrogenase [Mycoplana sp.]
MTDTSRPLAISAPEPRTLELIFTPEALDLLRTRYRIVEADPEDIAGLGDAVLSETRYIIGQPPLSAETLARMPKLRCILNVESNLINNMPYDVLFARGIHVVTTGQVFAEVEVGIDDAARQVQRHGEAELGDGLREDLPGRDDMDSAGEQGVVGHVVDEI